MQSLQSFILNTLYTKHRLILFSTVVKNECGHLSNSSITTSINVVTIRKKFNMSSQTNSLDYTEKIQTENKGIKNKTAEQHILQLNSRKILKEKR